MSSDITEKGRAVFLAALMVLSVVAMTTAFAGSAAAQTAEITITSDDTAAEAVEKIQSMPSNKAIAAAPIATGILLTGTTAREVTQHGFEIWTALALAGASPRLLSVSAF